MLKSYEYRYRIETLIIVVMIAQVYMSIALIMLDKKLLQILLQGGISLFFSFKEKNDQKMKWAVSILITSLSIGFIDVQPAVDVGFHYGVFSLAFILLVSYLVVMQMQLDKNERLEKLRNRNG